MKLYQLYGLCGVLLIVAAMSGCTDRGAMSLRPETPSGLAEPSADASGVEATAVGNIESERTAAPPVQPASAQTVAKPVLITLPKDGDLSAQIGDASGPVLLDFFATWCGPCRTQSEILHEAEATAAENQTRIIKIDVDQHPQLAKEFQVSSLPTLLMVKNGEVVERQSGIASKERLVAWMQ